MKIPLEVRFKQFLALHQETENIDEVIPPYAFDGKKRADYLLANRKIILELKTLETDTSAKAQKEIDKHQHRKDFPLVFGKVNLQEILRHLPDGEEINKRIYQDITRSVEGAVRSAEEQIRDTKEILHLDHSVGFLVLLNEVWMSWPQKSFRTGQANYCVVGERQNPLHYPSISYGSSLKVTRPSFVKGQTHTSACCSKVRLEDQLRGSEIILNGFRKDGHVSTPHLLSIQPQRGYLK
jgi:hypothetical protein